MDGPTLKRKVTVVSRINAHNDPSPPPSPALRYNPTNLSRPPSPTKSSLSTDTFRPKVKVSSSATVRKATTVVGTRSPSSRPNSSSGRDTAPLPRPASPTKVTPRIRSTLSPSTQPKVAGASPLRSATPELRTRAFTASSDTLRTSDDVVRARNSTFSLQHSVSHSQLHPSNDRLPRRTPASELSPGSSTSVSPPVRIKSKVTAISRHEPPTPSPSGSSHLSPRPATARARAPSISSTSSVHSTPPPHGIYPITTASPAANPHRYATPRPSPSRLNSTLSHAQYQPFGRINDESPLQNARVNGSAKVDPASIPLPPTSPPSSSLSFSSKSSVSHSSYASESSRSLSSAPTTQRNGSPEGLATTLDNLQNYVDNREDNPVDSGQDTDTEDDEERKARAQAKSDRKIADLEITNRSLLAINATLESTKDRQAKEIRELRRKLRESRLILPPVAFRAVKSSLDHDDTAEESEDSQDSEDEEEEAEDEAYKRVKTILEGLLETGKQALEVKKEDFHEGGKGVAKVLTADEVRTWRDSRGAASDIDSQSILEVDRDDEEGIGGAINRSQQTLIPDEADIGSTASYSRASSPVPPILITHSS